MMFRRFLLLIAVFATLSGAAQDFDAILSSAKKAAAASKKSASATLGGIADAMRAEQSRQQADVIDATDGIARAMREQQALSAADSYGNAAHTADFYSSDIKYSTYGSDARTDIANSSASTHVNPYLMGNYSTSTTFAAPGGKAYINRNYGPPQQTPVPGKLTSGFGYRPAFGRMHKGVDLALNTGDTVRSAFAGKVVLVSNDPKGYGRYVKVKHDSGLETLYGHLSAPLVTHGQRIAAGQPLGLGGATGNATGPHLHFETRINGTAVDPSSYFNFGKPGGQGRKKPTTPLNDNASQKPKKNADAAKPQQHKPKIKSETIASAAAPKNGGLKPRTGSYKVRRGDTIDKIAREHGMSVSELCRINKMSKYTPMYTGKVIRLK